MRGTSRSCDRQFGARLSTAATYPRRSCAMPYVDRIIQFMQTQAGERIVLVNDQDCVIYRPGGSTTTVPQRFSTAQIGGMLHEIMNEEDRRRLTSGASFAFQYDSGTTA